MKLHNGLDVQHLMKMLTNALLKEQDQWKPVLYKSNSATQEVGGVHRDEVVGWILCLNRRFQFSPETVALSVAVTDRFLSLVKVRPKYLQCIAISCFYIAAKTLEEDEVIPSAVELVKTSQCGCAVSDILRMEMIILNKLQWNVRTVTQIDYLHIIHSLLMCYYPQLLESVANMTPSRHLSILSRNLFHCLANHKMVGFRPIALTLAVISLELEQITPVWLSIIHTVQKMAEVDIDSMIRCREIAGQILKDKSMLPTGYQFVGAPPARRNSLTRSQSFKRKGDQMELEDDVYDGIKRLYSEETSSVPMTTCASEFGQGPDGEGMSVHQFPQTKPVCAN
ncbi:cyclin-I-like [Dreissena polymorpha]|uniref:cyclin-I-like n=1 Tax=Dreissena polymorpha TaxID=45954 RepID=UPI0022641CF2|nr:cyclin-I-like [Dreissena polymorpha]XP_052277842.1 cyclin-I-like [Dreissena polymorpha]